MSRHRTRAWLWFAATALPLLAVMGWLTATLVALDHDELQARRQAQLHERLRLALWRMDSWLSPQMSREAMRPPSDYQAFAPATTAWTRGYSKLSPDDVLVQSPLLAIESELFALHFEVLPNGEIQSPQVPTGNQRDVCESNGLDRGTLDRAKERLAALRPLLLPAVLEQRIGGAESLLPMLGCNSIPTADTGVQAQQSVAEYNTRQFTNAQNLGQWQSGQVRAQQGATAIVPVDAPSGPAGPVGPMVPFWLDGGGEPLLVFGRRVHDTSGSRLQGVVLGWRALQDQLLQLVPDLFDSGCARILRCDAPSAAEQACMLATVPARLDVRLPESTLASGLPLTTILWVTWGVTLLGLGVLGFTLRAAIGFGERRARFASAVTHELRTPLTTFRMYSEMLADGIVTEPAAQKEYLTTLQRESDRLSRVVENVLAWSKLEEGRFTSRRERHGVQALVERLVPMLHRRLADVGMTLHLHVDTSAQDAVVTTDEDAVGQILFNLVDNAAKYAKGGDAPTVDLGVRAVADAVIFEVRDHGPGVAASHRRSIFAPFDRGTVPVSSNDTPGTGLGLPLARGLARDLGGDLVLDDRVSDGACFVLRLPAA